MMDFDSKRPIYLQIFDVICDRILSGEFKPDERIPSVREYGASVGVNPNTVMRTYEKLTGGDIIFNKRGIGYFVSPDAPERIRQAQRTAFMEDELPRFISRMKLLGMDPEEVCEKIRRLN